MKNSKTAIVLGGTNPHIALINNLKKRGYYTILLDYYENPPAKQYADEHIIESTLDLEKVLEVAKNKKADLVISTSIDQANVTACYVGEKLGLPIPYSYQTALEVTNKGLMKKMMLEGGIQTSKYLYLTGNYSIDYEKLSYPVMVKPADSCASAGVKKALNELDLKEHLQFALTVSRAKEAIVEEFVTGKEISIYSFIRDYNVEIIMMSERHSVIDGEKDVLKCYATTTPVSISTIAMMKIQTNANLIAKVFNLNNTPLHIQVFVNGDDINIIEFAPRVGGGMSYSTIFSNTGFDIIDATIDSFLGNTVIPDYSPPKYHYAINIIYANSGIFKSVIGYEELIKDDVVENVYFYKPEGTVISDDKANSSRIVAFITKSNGEENMYKKARLIINSVDILDKEGNSMMRKDLFLHKPSHTNIKELKYL